MKTTIALLRSCPVTAQASFRCYQRRWAQVHDVRYFNAHYRRPDRVLDKYQEKLDRKAREEGLKDVSELKQAYADKIQHLRNKALVPGANAPLNIQTPPQPDQAAASIPYQPPPAPEPQTTHMPKRDPPVKTLSSFVDVEKTAALPPKEIETIWRLCHARDAQSLCAVMPAATFTRISKTARRHPQFILPVPREGQGAEIHFMQWTFPSPTTATVLFTHLAEFKLRGEYAQPHTTVTYHLDLMERKDLVLLEGRVAENRGITVDEGKWLLMCLQKFYGFEAYTDAAKASASSRRKLIEQFSGGDKNFRVEELLEEAEKVP